MRVLQLSPPFLVFGFLDNAGCACGDNYTGNTVPALGHDYVLVDQVGTVVTYQCTRCGATKSVVVPVDPDPPVEYSLRNGSVSVVTECHEYIYASGLLLREVITTTDEDGNVTTEVLDFTYDTSGSPYTLTYTNGTASPVTYYYVVNLQGDVMRLVAANGATVAEYWYGPYGEVLTATGTMAEVNPLRYRGYYADADTGFYYLQSRYYDPATCRFVNADGLVSTGQRFLGYNMFAYCNNSPIILTDSNGNSGTVPQLFEAAPENMYDAIEMMFEITSFVIEQKENALAIAQTIYGEAGGRYVYPDEWQKGQEAVAYTIINRYNSGMYPNDWYKIVAAEYQFTGYNRGKNLYESGDLDSTSWIYAYRLAWLMVFEQYKQIPLPEGFTDQHMYFRQDNNQSPENWDKILRIAGNAFFCYKD